jgi:hypothetical protein
MRQHRRLLALFALSLMLHVLALTWVTRQVTPTSGMTLAAPPAPLALRLQPAHATAPSEPDHAEPMPAPEPAPEPEPETIAPLASGPATPATEPAAAPTESLPAAPQAGPPGQTAMVQMPSRYRSTMPPSTAITYALVQPGRAKTTAQLRWKTDGSLYTVRSDGVMGKLSAEGGTSDAGVAPKTSAELRAGGKRITTTFSIDTIAINGRDFPNSVGSQDRASLLLQLTGMGLSAPDQLRNVIDIYVAGEGAPEIMTFHVGDDEELETPLGAIATRHLVQVTRAGEARLEIWLAPARDWVPVQLRLTAPNGAVSTQTVTRIEAAGQ